MDNSLKITLFSYVTSPYAMKVHCYLLYKRLPFDVFYVNPINPAKELPIGRQIPTLTIGAETRGESSLLGVWLDEKFPDTARLIPDDKQEKKNIHAIDDWISNTLIPTTFYCIYPQYNSHFITGLTNTLRLGYCVDRTTTNSLPTGLRFLWPLFIRNTNFIRQMIVPFREHGSVYDSRVRMLSYLDKKLENSQFLAETTRLSLADLSAWPSLIVPYKMGLKGFDDFKLYPHVYRWIKEIEPFVATPNHEPPLIPEQLILRGL